MTANAAPAVEAPLTKRRRIALKAHFPEVGVCPAAWASSRRGPWPSLESASEIGVRSDLA